MKNTQQELFFQVSQIFWPIGQIGQIILWGIFGIFGNIFSTHIVTVSLVLDFPLFSHYFYKKLMFYWHFKGISIWAWDMILECKELEIWSSCVRSPWMNWFS